MPYNKFSPRPSNVFFIDSVYLKQATSLNNNVDDKMVVEGIRYAQDLYILPILGNGLFEEMLIEISGGTLANNPSHLKLVTEFIQPTLAAASMIHILPFTSFQFKNKGVEKAKSDYSEPASRSEIEWIIEAYRERAAFWAQRTTQFLVANTDTYLNYLNPQLGTQGSGADLFYPQKSAYNCGIFLEGLGSNSSLREYSGWGLSLEQFIEMRGQSR